jgi:hypothetical protein
MYGCVLLYTKVCPEGHLAAAAAAAASIYCTEFYCTECYELQSVAPHLPFEVAAVAHARQVEQLGAIIHLGPEALLQIAA